MVCNGCGDSLKNKKFDREFLICKKCSEEDKMAKENIVLGDGSHKVLACMGENKKRGKYYALAIIPHQDEKKRIVGDVIPDGELPTEINDKVDTAIYFTNTEAIDVVIENLEKIKAYIGETKC